MQLKIQILSEKKDQTFCSEKLEWVISFAKGLETHYGSPPLITTEVFCGNNILQLDADLFVSPVSAHQVKVGFKPMALYNEGMITQEVGISWITISDNSFTGADALSNFLLFFVGFVMIPNTFGWHMTDFSHFKAILKSGNNGTLISFDSIRHEDLADVAGLMVWLNKKGIFIQNLHEAYAQLHTAFKKKEIPALINVTNYLVLKTTGLALLIKNQ